MSKGVTVSKQPGRGRKALCVYWYEHKHGPSYQCTKGRLPGFDTCKMHTNTNELEQVLRYAAGAGWRPTEKGGE